MNKSDLYAKIANNMTHIAVNQLDDILNSIIEQIMKEIEENGRIEIRGFGSFSLNYRAQRQARNPKTGETIIVPPKYIPYFKPGKELKERINQKK